MEVEKVRKEVILIIQGGDITGEKWLDYGFEYKASWISGGIG